MFPLDNNVTKFFPCVVCDCLWAGKGSSIKDARTERGGVRPSEDKSEGGGRRVLANADIRDV